MTILNIGINEKTKKKLKDIVKVSEYKTVSELVRSTINAALKIEETQRAASQEIEIPEWIPEGKYIAFVKGSIAAVGDSIAEVSREAAAKFPNESCIIRRQGKKIQLREYVFSAFSELKCWQYSMVEDRRFPLIVVRIGPKNNLQTIRALPDSAASMSILKKEYFEQFKLPVLRTEKVFSAGGIVELEVVETHLRINELTLKSEFLVGEIPDELPFDLLIGRNILDKLDLYLLGKKNVVCIKDP